MARPRRSVEPLPLRPAEPHLLRARKALRRRRRNRLWRLLRPLLLPVMLLAVGGAGAAWLLTSPRFAVAEVEVAVAGERVSPSWVAQRLAPLLGENLLRLRLPEVEAQLAGEPWVGGVKVEKELPGRLRLTVAERRAAVLLERGDRLYWADGDGALIAPLAAGEAAGPEAAALVRVHEARPPAAGEAATAPSPAVPRVLELLAELQAAAPRWAEGLTEVDALGDDDFRIRTAALPFPVLLKAGEVAARSSSLEELLPQILARFAALEAVDLRFSRRIVLRPMKSHAPSAAQAATGAFKADERTARWQSRSSTT